MFGPIRTNTSGRSIRVRSSLGLVTTGPSILSQMTVYFSDVDTEVWEFDAIEDRNKVIEPKLEKYSYYYGMALFPVDSEFCKKRCVIFCWVIFNKFPNFLNYLYCFWFKINQKGCLAAIKAAPFEEPSKLVRNWSSVSCPTISCVIVWMNSVIFGYDFHVVPSAEKGLRFKGEIYQNGKSDEDKDLKRVNNWITIQAWSRTVCQYY